MGATGEGGANAYEVAVANGFVGTEAEWLESLQGEQGETGPTGPTGALEDNELLRNQRSGVRIS